MPKKIFYLSSEVDPFSNTYPLAEFSKKLCSRLHDIDDFDIRLNQPKYGYISERKYILREVIRLKDMIIDFGNGEDSVNLKSAFIPNTRVQIYFTESEIFFKPVSELLYKSKNGRDYKNNHLKFAFFSKVALETIKRLFWQPDIIICNDWQMSYLPILLKHYYGDDEYYKGIKTVMVLHSINDYRFTSKYSYEYVNLTCPDGKIDNLEESISCSDYLIIIDDDKQTMQKKFNKTKNLLSASKKSKTLFINTGTGESTDWTSISKKIETLLRKM